MKPLKSIKTIEPIKTTHTTHAERPRWIVINVPVLRYPIKTPQKISKLVYQMNLRGFRTAEIVWGDPILIEFESHSDFVEKIKQSRFCGKQDIINFYQYLIDFIDFKVKIHPYTAGTYEPVKIYMCVKHSQIKTLETLFYKAFIHGIPDEHKMEQKYNKQITNND